MSTPDESGRQIADWLVRLVNSQTLTRQEVNTRMERTDEDLALLLALYAVGPQAALCRARQRAVLGIPGHQSAPPGLAVELAETMRDHVSGTPLAPELVEALAEVRAHWRTGGAFAVSVHEAASSGKGCVDPEDLAAGLRAWTRGHEPHVRAAVELLIAHDDGMWLRREEFVQAFVEQDEREATINFHALSRALDEGVTFGASSTEVGILRLAADLRIDRWHISRMGDDFVHLVRVAVAAATE